MKGIIERLGKYKYTVLILLLGVGLMLFPTGRDSPKPEAPEPTTDLEAELEEILRRVDGAGEVDVLLTYAEGTFFSYQVNETRSTDDSRTEQEQETVLVSTDAGDAPVIVRTRYPTFRGAVVVCEGADRPSVRLDIVNAVSSLTGLSSDKISVIKMSVN